MVQKHKTRDVERSGVVQRKSTQAVRSQSEHKQSSPPANVLQRTATKHPAALKPADILALQRTVGNRAVQRMLIQRRVDTEDLRRLGPVRSMEHGAVDNVRVHNNSARAAEFFGRSFTHRSDPHFPRPLEEDRIPHEAWHAVQPRLGRVRPTVQLKLAVGPANDHYEQEADRVAASVMSESGTPQIQRQEEEDETIQTKSLASTITPLIQRQSEETDEETPVQRRSYGGQPNVESGLEDVIGRTRGGGQPLPDGLLMRMEKSFGADFSGVRVHANSESDSLNRSLHARAFTTGHDMFFRRGEYNPDSRRGQELIAHELTHVVQQNGGTSGKKNLSLKRSTGTVIQRGVVDWLKKKFSSAKQWTDEQRGEFQEDVVGQEYGNIGNQKGAEYRRQNYNEDRALDMANYTGLGVGGGLATGRALTDLIKSPSLVSDLGKDLSILGAVSAGVGVATAGVDAYKGLKEFRDKAKTGRQRAIDLGLGVSGLGNVAQQSATTIFHTANKLGGTALAAGAELATGGAAILTGAVDIIRGMYAESKAKQNIARLRNIQSNQKDELIAKAARQARSTQQIRKDTSTYTTGKGILSVIGGSLLVLSAATTPMGWLLIGTAALVGFAGAVKKWRDKKQRRLDIVARLLGFDKDVDDWKSKVADVWGTYKPHQVDENLKKWWKARKLVKPLEAKVEKEVKDQGYVSVDHYYSNYINKTANDLYNMGVAQRLDVENQAKEKIDQWSEGQKRLENAEAKKEAVKDMPFSQIINLHNCEALKTHVYGDLVKLLNAMGLMPAFRKGQPTPEKIGKALHD